MCYIVKQYYNSTTLSKIQVNKDYILSTTTTLRALRALVLSMLIFEHNLLESRWILFIALLDSFELDLAHFLDCCLHLMTSLMLTLGFRLMILTLGICLGMWLLGPLRTRFTHCSGSWGVVKFSSRRIDFTSVKTGDLMWR